MDLQLYSYYRSSCAYRVRIALNLKNLDYEYKAVHLLNNGGEQNAPEYTRLNAKAEVPTLVHKNFSLSQSTAIIEYLDEVFPNPPLYPKDLQQKALVRSACEVINSGTQPLQNLRALQQLKAQFDMNDDAKKNWMQFWIHRGLHAFEAIISQHSGKFCFGDQMTAADIFLVPQVFSSQRFGVEVDKYTTIKKVYAHCQDLKAFQQAHPSQQPDTPERTQ